MKIKINFFKTLTLLLLTLSIVSCSKDDQEFQEDSMISNNDESFQVTTNASNTITGKDLIITGNMVRTVNYIYRMDLEIENKHTGEKLPTLIHQFESADQSDISNIRRNFSSFTGSFSIIYDGHIIKKKTIKNGLVVSEWTDPYSGEKYPCTVDGITTCADDEINDMNWIEYAFCALDAPMCLAELYISCAWENC